MSNEFFREISSFDILLPKTATTSKQRSTWSKESFDLLHSTMLRRHCGWCGRGFTVTFIGYGCHIGSSSSSLYSPSVACMIIWLRRTLHVWQTSILEWTAVLELRGTGGYSLTEVFDQSLYTLQWAALRSPGVIRPVLIS